jgi:hypothetical protein
VSPLDPGKLTIRLMADSLGLGSRKDQWLRNKWKLEQALALGHFQ